MNPPTPDSENPNKRKMFFNSRRSNIRVWMTFCTVLCKQCSLKCHWGDDISVTLTLPGD